MAAPSYTQVASTQLYVSSELPSGSGWCGYWASRSNALGPSADLAATWNDKGGVYLILTRVPGDLAALAQDLGWLVPKLSPTGLGRVLWIVNSDGALPNYWQTALLDALPDPANPQQWETVTRFNYTLGSYTLSIAGEARISLLNGPSIWGFQFDPTGSTFACGTNVFPAGAAIHLPLGGSGTGAIKTQLALKKQTPDPLDQLGVMIRYAAPATLQDDPRKEAGLARYLSMPVLRISTGTLTVDLRLDPSAPLEPQRSALGLYDAKRVSVPLTSAFVTTLGYSIELIPAAVSSPLPSARLCFCRSPIFASRQGNEGDEKFHLAPDGTFFIDVLVPPPVKARREAMLTNRLIPEKDHWMFGMNGAEYGVLAATGRSVACFRSGMDAWVALDTPDPKGKTPLTDAATTAYMTLLPPPSGANSLPYYAQPLQSPLFMGGTNGFFDFHTMPAGNLPQWPPASGGDPLPVFPVGAYAWLDDNRFSISAAKLLENGVIAPRRREVIGGRTLSFQEEATANTDPPLAVTPQGLFAELSNDLSEWTGVYFAHMPDSINKKLRFSPVKEKFQEALQSNQLFFVISNVAEFDSQSGVPGGSLDCDIEGWTFRLAPDNWRTQGNPTLMLFKYANRSLNDLARDSSAWGWKDAANDLQTTQKRLITILDDVIKRSHPESPSTLPDGDPYLIFYDEVVNNPMWNGVLFFNAPVDFSQMPQELRFLAAGTDTSKFYAHHVGFSMTPYTSSGKDVVPQQTAAFGLIDYEDPTDLAPSETIPFGFKTLQLKVRFANARIADFAAQAELMVNRLFGAPLNKQDPERGNNLVMTGSCQRVAGVASYSFVLSGENLFTTQGSSLVSVEILTVRINASGGDGSDTDPLTSVFTLEGNLRFIYQEDFDLYSYGSDDNGFDGYLRFGNLSIAMTFTMADPTNQSFSSTELSVTFDSTKSPPRPNSLAARFPLKISGIVISAGEDPATHTAAGQTPEQMGFVSISCPLDQTPMNPPWYGLLFTIDLGTLGALAGSAGISLSLIAAWSQGTGQDSPAYLGIKFPSLVPGAGSLPIQGVLKLGFRSFRFLSYLETSGSDAGKRFYQLWMNRFALSVLCWSFPPGNADLVLFGNPDNPQGALGWYAAYSNDPPAGEDNKTRSADDGRGERLEGGRRNRLIG